MTIEVKLSPELESRLKAEAEARGLSLETAAEFVLREALDSPINQRRNVTVEDFHSMLKAIAAGSEHLPALATKSFNRQSFYEDGSR